MLIWPTFTDRLGVYDLSHLNAHVFIATRAASGAYPARSVRIFVSYSNHCFTNHFADEGKDDGSIYLHAGDGRYFCEDRYKGSLVLPGLIPELIEKNILLGRAVKERRETFFYLEERRMDRDFRIFMKIERSNHPDSDIRLIITSCHPEETWAAPVGAQGRFNIWRVMDAKLSGKVLAVGAQLRRKRR